MASLPPFSADPRVVPLVIEAARELTVFGAPAHAALLPHRARRANRPGETRPAFRRNPAAHIVSAEAMWRGDGLALTPNRYPMLAEQRILWHALPQPHPGLPMWRAVHEWVDAHRGSALHNTVGAAASIAAAHVHLTRERSSFLSKLPLRPGTLELVEVDDLQIEAAAVPFCLLRLSGAPKVRAAGVEQLAGARLTAAWNVVVEPGATWVYPRRKETPAPHFPQALGAAELWGRWCHTDEAGFEAASAAAMERALVEAGCEPL
ncbi:MAG: hypothetical protein H6838_03160 [Planctomycetes bacterium]|nr:hypothetical protein [Planctomycetota bacterium]MCB9884461.1 hypothetical protein [Planctomycetota bacterium]